MHVSDDVRAPRPDNLVRRPEQDRRADIVWSA